MELDSFDEESVFYQLQAMFGHLLESKLQYYTPEKFWKCFKLWGQPVNVREQQVRYCLNDFRKVRVVNLVDYFRLLV